MFKALVLTQSDDTIQAALDEFSDDVLPQGEVLVDIAYSALNYKDALAISGMGKIVKSFPMVPGIDFTGTVLASQDARYRVGDEVIATGWGLGEKYWGGLAQRARVPGDWLVHMPRGLDAFSAMVLGTAGLTAMLCVSRLREADVTPASGQILVTGATGAVGSIAVQLLSRLGYRVAAVTGKADMASYLQSLGAQQILARDTMSKAPRPLETQRWAGAVDVVGGDVLARVLAETHYGGAVAACGLAGDYRLETTVMPFILRNISLLGVDSVYCPPSRRRAAWQELSERLPENFYTQIGQTISLSEVPATAKALLSGDIRGRIVVDVRAD